MDIERAVSAVQVRVLITEIFLSLLDFFMSAGDKVWKDNSPQNAMYTSPDIKNQVIDVLGDHIRDKAQCSTIIADEVTDCSNKEQICHVKLWTPKCYPTPYKGL